jgi:hypothetical protein
MSDIAETIVLAAMTKVLVKEFPADVAFPGLPVASHLAVVHPTFKENRWPTSATSPTASGPEATCPAT